MESHTYTVYGSIDPHQHSSFLEDEGKKTGVVIAGNPCILSKFNVSLSARRICLVGVNLLESSKHSWDLHDSCILVNVAGDGPHVSRFEGEGEDWRGWEVGTCMKLPFVYIWESYSDSLIAVKVIDYHFHVL